MKRSVLRIGCAVLSLSAAAGLLASCSLLPPASPLPDSKPALPQKGTSRFLCALCFPQSFSVLWKDQLHVHRPHGRLCAKEYRTR